MVQIEGVIEWVGGTNHPMPAPLDIAPEVRTSEFVCLIGPSGPGKPVFSRQL